MLNKTHKVILFSLLFLGFFLCSCENKKPKTEFKRYDLSGHTQGTTFNIVYVDSTNKLALIKHKVDSILKAIDNSVSTYNENSLVSKLNQSDSCFLIDNHILSLFLLSDEIK